MLMFGRFTTRTRQIVTVVVLVNADDLKSLFKLSVSVYSHQSHKVCPLGTTTIHPNPVKTFGSDPAHTVILPAVWLKGRLVLHPPSLTPVRDVMPSCPAVPESSGARLWISPRSLFVLHNHLVVVRYWVSQELALTSRTQRTRAVPRWLAD